MKRNSGNRKRKKGTIVGMILAILLVVAAGTVGVYFLRIRVRKGCEASMAIAAEQQRKEVVSQLNDRMVYLNVLAKLLGGEAEGDNRLPDMKKMKEEAKALEVGIYFDIDGHFYLSDGYVGTFEDSTLRDSVAENSYAIMLSKVPEISNKTMLAIVLPIYENNKVCGIVFGYFDINEFVNIFSKPVYENGGYSFMADTNGKVIVPSSAISKVDENGELWIAGEENTEALKTMVNNTIKNGGRFVENEQAGIFAYSVALDELTDLAIISVVEAEVLYKNMLKVSVGIISATGLVAFLLFVQFIVMLTSEHHKKKEIAEAVNIDDLTGLSTKQHHKEECEAILKKAKGRFAYVVLDVSDFSAINAASGYEYGNAVLKNIAKVLTEEMDKNECCSRTSADHFATLLRYENQEKLIQRIYAICNKAGNLPEDIKNQGSRFAKENIIFNCGVYLIQSNNEDINRIRARANTARKNLRKAINTQISFYNDDDFRKKMENHELEMDLLKAVANNEMVVYLQPKYGAVSEKINGAEALVRWNHPVKGLISPNSFIPIAENDGFVKVIDFYVFETVCKTLNDWKNRGIKPVAVSVNFSRLHLSDEDFVQHLSRLANEYDIDPGLLEIELTETADFGDMDVLLNVMYRIKEAGFGLAMDDFGSGYSSLQLLMKMPAGVLKMDKSLIDDCKKDNEADNMMAANIISLAQGRGHSVVAEGVETQEQKDILRDANCDMIQGYYYSKPITVEAFEGLLAE